MALLEFILTLRAQVNSYSVIPFGTLTYPLGNTELAPSHVPPAKLEDRDTADLINKRTSVSDQKQANKNKNPNWNQNKSYVFEVEVKALSREIQEAYMLLTMNC